MNYSEVLRTIETRLRADLQRSGQVQHRGSKGRLRESSVAEVVRRLIPETVGVAHGAEVVSSDGSTSGECDLVIYDRDVPALYRGDEGEFTVFPIEAVMGVIEVKSKLDRQGLESSIETAYRLKTMPHSARVRDGWDIRQVRRHGRLWDHRPVSFHIFAFDSTDLPTLLGHLAELEDGRPRWERIESIYVVDVGWLWNTTMDERVLVRATDSVLLPFSIEVGTTYQRGWEPRFVPAIYQDEASMGTPWKVGGTWSDDGLEIIRPETP